MSTVTQETNARTRKIEEALKGAFPRTKVYQYNVASIRVRIIDEQFRGKSNPERDDLVWPLLEGLPEELQADITVLLLLAPEEVEHSLMNQEFENPSPSML